MRYDETPLPTLDALAKAVWSLQCDGDAANRVEHDATPDGCVEIIHRLQGRSHWRRPQPAFFVAGIVDRPARLHFSADARFVGLRLWPWTWHALGGLPCAEFINDWRPLARSGLSAPIRRLLASIGDGGMEALGTQLAAAVTPDDRARGRAVLSAESVADLAARSACPMRQLQRWFQRCVGLPPRTYLRLLRFQDTLSAVQEAPGSLADQAARQGYADQAHMAREFRTLGGTAARTARKRARGPFL